MSPERRDVGRSGGIACPRAGVIATHDVGPPKIGRARVLARRHHSHVRCRTTQDRESARTRAPVSHSVSGPNEFVERTEKRPFFGSGNIPMADRILARVKPFAFVAIA
jgi:hypothetical protein